MEELNRVEEMYFQASRKSNKEDGFGAHKLRLCSSRKEEQHSHLGQPRTGWGMAQVTL